ncbi:protein purity of essence [Anopheles darlingi]|uniref:protein purity of essence n=1 Tax=Anopheles darlingi TaxID=43151 RepID=UPI002100289F|nr:protein purity of essence [Anopheles darlingi]
MAGHGVDWSAVLKPFLSSSSENVVKNDMTTLVRTIIQNENEILEHDPAHKQFFDNFVVLAAENIANQVTSLSQTKLPQYTEASSILIRYVIQHLDSTAPCKPSILLMALKILCEGKKPDENQPTTSAVSSIISISGLKCLKYPEIPGNKSSSSVGTSSSSAGGSGSVTSDKDSPKVEMKRSRSDLSTVILQQLSTPLGNGAFTFSALSEEQTDCTDLFIKHNLQCMNAINAGNSLLNWCNTALTTLAKYRFKYEECTMLGRPLYLPATTAEANSVKSMFNFMESDISNLLLAISLPMVEPLTPKKITLLSQCAIAALYCGVLTSTASSVLVMATAASQKSASSGQLQQTQGQTSSGQSQKETEEEEDFARAIVDKALEIFTKIGNLLKSSTRTHIYQNYLCIGAWLLISGIQGTMGASGNTSGLQQIAPVTAKTSEESLKGRSPLKTLDVPQIASAAQPSPALRVNLFKVQQGFGVLNAAIARHSITLLTELIDDLKIDSRTDEEDYSSIESAGFDILAQYTSIQRVVRVLNSATLQQLLTFLATVSYRKACTLRRINTKNTNEGEPMSYSDSTTYFNDTFSCSEESEPEEEDSDSYLGLWFKETLSPEANEEMTESQEQESKDEKGRHGSHLVPAKDEPHEYLNLASLIFNFFDTSLGGNHVYLNRYVKTGLSEQQMVLMANILRDLDRDSTRSDQDNSGCLQWQNAMVKFSGSVGKYLHNLISNSLLNESLQSALLLHLGVSPWTQDSNVWPLQVYPRTLAVLVQILLLKPSQEKEAACLSVWHRLVNTLVEGICTTPAIPNESEVEDLNVEHAQLLLFLFHSLNLMQKKSILLLTAGGVIRCSEVCRSVTPEKPLRDHQIMLLSRLLLFLEYLMKHLYNPPNVLLEQVRWNLFSVFSLDGEQKLADLVNYKTKLMSFCRKDIEDKHRKLANEFSVGGVKPKFYSLTTVDAKVQQEFKLDGLAWNFILCTPDKLKYPWLIDALIDILGIADMCLARIPFQTLCAVHYCFSLCWKLLLGLPPSTQHVEALMQERTPNLHSLLWSIRCLHPITHSHYLIVNSLVKQGMYTQSAEAMWNRLTDHVSDVKYSLKMTLLGLDSFAKNFSPDQPRLSKIILLDSLVSHLYAICWAEKEGVNVKTSKSSSSSTSSASATSGTAAGSSSGSSSVTTLTGSSSESGMSAVNSSSSVSTTIAQTDGNPTAIITEVSRADLTKALMNALLDVLEILREATYKTMFQNLSGQIPACLIEPLIAIAGSKNQFCPELAQQLISCITGHDKDVITVEWRKSLSGVGEENFTSGSFPVEVHTLTIIEAHLTETSKHLSYSILLSLKHSLKSAINLVYYMLPNYDDNKLDERLKELLIPMVFDLRAEYLHESINRCLESLLGGDSNSEAYQLAAFTNIIRHSYQFLIEYTDLCATGRATNIEESVLCNILKYWETLLDKPNGLRAMRDFFYETKSGDLVQILLSFTGTSISQAYSTQVLQFFEKLFQAAERLDAPFDEEELCICIAELAITDSARLKSWLSHILLGPGGISLTANASNNSSNVPTPTNMATVSAIPSITDQLAGATTAGSAGAAAAAATAVAGTSENTATNAGGEGNAAQPSNTAEADHQDAMDIDYECMTKGGGGSGWQGAATSSGGAGVLGKAGLEDTSGEALERNGMLLQSLVKYIVAENRISSSVSEALFQALIQIGHNLLAPSQEAVIFSDLLLVMITLADAGNGRGHAMLFAAAIEWLDICRAQVLESGKNGASGWRAATQFNNVTAILIYMNDLLLSLGAKGTRSMVLTWDEESPIDAEDILEELAGDEDDSTVEDSDEDSLGNKLCTFSVTQKDFMNQHWYYCHTCKMVDGVGVCSVCARVCHKNHDISYAKYGNFFCDCGAKEDGSCQALSRRTGSGHAEDSILGSSSSGSLLPRANDTESVVLTASGVSNRRRRPSSPAHDGQLAGPSARTAFSSEKESNLAKIIETSREALNNPSQWKTVVQCILAFFSSFMPSVKEHCARYSPVGCHWRAQNALERLHSPEKSYVLSDEIMIATLGSQEGAFENVRMSYAGEQGQTIKQLLSTYLVRRVALCCLASPHGKRQQLAISHEKGKVTILQLSALLKQADAAKRKLTLTRLASAPVPCTVLSLASNPANEDFLAVCGLKECHILTFSSSGAANEHIVLTPQLETGNFIKRAIWLPASQTKLALVTADFVKIYDLAEDSYSPQYYFLVPSGKIRDCTFVYDQEEGTYYMLIMSSLGYIYTQPLSDESLAKHGPFYVTSTLELDHPLITDDNGQILMGGVSIYYSHVLQMLFFSYSAGRNFMAPLTNVNEGTKCVINLVCNPSSKLFSKATTQPLCQWTEIPGHPGLVCAMMQSLNNPVIFMIKPDGYMAQEIKAQNPKAKIMDMVAIRHSVSGVEKTTLILLCEDGSLRIYTAHPENTGYWLSPEVQPISYHQQSFGYGGGKQSRKSKKSAKQSAGGGGAGGTGSSSGSGKAGASAAPVFPIDFFEHCTLMNEVEYGGNDLLQIYNTQHLKHRLNSTGLYVTSTKANGFTLDVINNDQNMVITGVRIQIGSQDVTKAPQRVTIHGRAVTTIAIRARWFDIPLTREESLQSDKKLSIHFGPSADAEQITILDSIKIYGKTKDAFGWPEETEDASNGSQMNNGAAASQVTTATSAGNTGEASAGGNGGGSGGTDGTASGSMDGLYMTSLDRMLSGMLHVLESGLSLLGGPSCEEIYRQSAIDVATTMILYPTVNVLQHDARNVLMTCHSSKGSYHTYKDREILNYIHNQLKQMFETVNHRDIDPEAYYRAVLMMRSIAIQRPQAMAKICTEQRLQILPLLMTLMKELYQITPAFEEPVAIVKRGLCHVEAVIYSLVEIIYAFALADSEQIEKMTKFFVTLLLDPAPIISHSAKQAMIRLLRPKIKRRKVLIESPPVCSTPVPPGSNGASASATAGGGAASAAVAAAPTPSTSGGSAGGINVANEEGAVGGMPVEVDAIESLGLEPTPGNQALASLEALLGVGFPHLLEAADTDEDTIMEIAIALSLQDNEVDLPTLQQSIANYQGRNRNPAAANLAAAIAGGSSFNVDSNASGGGSDDDEISNVATEGSTLRTSPAGEHAGSGSGGSESGCSGVESIGGTSGRSSTYEEQPNPSPPRTSTVDPLGVAAAAAASGAATSSSQPSTSSAGATAASASVGPSGQPAGESESSSSDSAGGGGGGAAENAMKLHVLRYSILNKLVDNFVALEGVNGSQCIPFMQVIVMLTSDLDGTQEADQQVLARLLQALIDLLEIPTTKVYQMANRAAKTEVQLVALRLIGVLMGKVKSKSSSSSSSAATTSSSGDRATASSNNTVSQAMLDNVSFVAQATANALMKNNAIPYCLMIMESFLPHWKASATATADEAPAMATVQGSSSSANAGSGGSGSSSGGVIGGPSNILLKPTLYGIVPDMQPFFARPFPKGSTDVFEMYAQVLTEMAVRLPYQILKLSTGHPSSHEWYHSLCEYMTATLCEYMMYMQSPVLRRQVRKLLLYICGSKEKYRQLRDLHSLDTHMKAVKKCCEVGSSSPSSSTASSSSAAVSAGTTATILGYDALVELTEHFRACQEIASIRTGNWQKFCVRNADILASLLNISCCQLEEGVSTIILQLLQSAICNSTAAAAAAAAASSGKTSTVTDSVTKASSSTSSKDRKDRDKSEESDTMVAPSESKFDPAQCFALVAQIFNQVGPTVLSKFIRSFLLETNSTAIRWQAHALVYAFYENSSDQHKETLLQCLWGLWPLLPAYGKRTAQFVDLLGFLTLNTRSLIDKLPDYTAQAVSVLRQQNELLSRHPNAPIYGALAHVLELEGFYLESEPCLVCNNPEMPFANIKLSTIKVDSKFTTTTTIVKLVQSHTISKIVLRIADLKRAKMVRTINIYYNNRTVQAVVELKNRPSMWHKARKVTLQSGQTDVKIDFSLPITACNLMIEYADFYETVSGSSESLQCPRCSAVVPANPGVCGNCGENVFQCHKCRAINYDEKDPFLCHSCGFCKYAKFDYSIYGRACCAVDPIESAEDRAKTVQSIQTSLEKADRSYKALQNNKQILELLVQKVSEHKLDRVLDESLIGASVVGGGGGGNPSQVNRVIQLLAQKYCVESKSTFEELSKIIQKVQACRKELVAYDRSQQDVVSSVSQLRSTGEGGRPMVAMNKCYGCALASTEQCLTLLRAMASNMACRVGLCSQGLVEELATNNLRRGTTQLQDEVRQLLCLLTRDLPDATAGLCRLLQDRVKMALSGTVPHVSLVTAVRHEMALLESMVGQEDSCWEMKLRTVVELFLQASRDPRGPATAVIHPCLRIVQSLICPPLARHKEATVSQLCTVQPTDGVTLSYEKWIAGDVNHSFASWKARMPPTRPKSTGGTTTSATGGQRQRTVESDGSSMAAPPPPAAVGFRSALEQRRNAVRNTYLMEKYARRWRQRALAKGVSPIPLELHASWLQPILFNTNSRLGRTMACALIASLSRTVERKREMLNLLTGFLRYVGESGEASGEFLTVYRLIADECPSRQYLALNGVLTLLVQLVTVEIEKIHCLEETTLSTDLAQGYALRQLVELMAVFLDNAQIRKTYKGKLLGPVLQGYLDLCKLIVQRTRLIDDAQNKLLEMLEEMTTGTEEETAAFMAVCIDTVRRTPTSDVKTPVFMFERLCSIIHPEENDVGEFFLTLEKDPQQEDYLQGRMLGNPYSSNEAGLGPLMRDVKNKICIDCELVALLDDDNGMELLVHNKIISLDLPVKEVYKKVWLQEGGDRDGMRIVYRMRGLLGDATEEFIETLNAKSKEEVDNEQLYRMANVLADCDGLKVMLDRIGSLQNVSKSRTLLQVLLKLFLLSVKVRRCQEVLCQPELGAINTLLKVLQLCLQSSESDAQQSAVTEQLLEIMETILSKASSDTLDSFLQFSLTFGGPEYVQALLSCTNCSNVRYNPSVLRHLIRVLAALVYGNDIKMALLCEHFRAIFDFDQFDGERTAEEEFKMELFCVLTTGIEHNSIGGTLKDYIMGLGIVDRALEYIRSHAPCVKPTLLRTDSDELKEFISRASLKYILRFLTGLATKHEATQLAVAKDIIPIIHRLEQVSSDEHVGSLAENLLEALCTEPATAKRVQEVRDFTRAEKKRLAMATREKQLDALGMRTNEKGQVTAKGEILSQIEKLREETGLSCFICREGYACQPNKVLGIYTFTKRANVEDYEMKQKKTVGYTTVTHFNVVHVDCHMNAIRLARSRDEWESASLQNANTRCNGLLPLWGPDVSESSFSSSMARHNNYMQECTQRCEITFSSSMHDLKLLLWRFAQEKSFHEDAGGGGPQSNMHLVAYLLFYGLYTLLSSRSYSREEMILSAFIALKPSERWLECAYEAEGPLYLLTMSLALHTPELWTRHKLVHLRRLIAIGHARHVSPNTVCKFLAPSDKRPKDYSIYKPYLMFWGLIDLIYRDAFRTVTTPKDEDWPISLFNYIRRNDESLLKSADNTLQTFSDEYLPCASFGEFCDVAGLLGDIENPDGWIEELLQALPSPGSSNSGGSSGGAGAGTSSGGTGGE